MPALTALRESRRKHAAKERFVFMSPEQLMEQSHQSSDIISAYEYLFCSDYRPFRLSKIASPPIAKPLLQGREKRRPTSFHSSENKLRHSRGNPILIRLPRSTSTLIDLGKCIFLHRVKRHFGRQEIHQSTFSPTNRATRWFD